MRVGMAHIQPSFLDGLCTKLPTLPAGQNIRAQPRRNYIVSSAEITSEQAVLFTLGCSTASSFYLSFDFISYLL